MSRPLRSGVRVPIIYTSAPMAICPDYRTGMGTNTPSNVEILSRIQFAFTIAFHYIYPPLSIGLGVCLVVMEGMYLKTKNKVYTVR